MSTGSNKKSNLNFLATGFAALSVRASVNAYSQNKSGVKLPNILWITSEDNSPLLGCYGDKFATTPNLDKLASIKKMYVENSKELTGMNRVNFYDVLMSKSLLKKWGLI